MALSEGQNMTLIFDFRGYIIYQPFKPKLHPKVGLLKPKIMPKQLLNNSIKLFGIFSPVFQEFKMCNEFRAEFNGFSAVQVPTWRFSASRSFDSLCSRLGVFLVILSFLFKGFKICNEFKAQLPAFSAVLVPILVNLSVS